MASRKQRLHGSPFEWEFRPVQAGVESVRQQLLSVIDDCEGSECDRLRWRVHTAECGQELWLLRDAVFQVVASQHCQLQAAQRINGLVPAFQRILPTRLLQHV